MATTSTLSSEATNELLGKWAEVRRDVQANLDIVIQRIVSEAVLENESEIEPENETIMLQNDTLTPKGSNSVY